MPDHVLILKIEIWKQRLIDLASKYGRDDQRVIRYSQRLDNLIAELMRRRLAG